MLLWPLLLACLLVPVLPARILLVLPFPGKSHHIFASAIMEALAERGHSLVEFSPYAPASPLPNHTHVPIYSEFQSYLDKVMDFDGVTKYGDEMYHTTFGYKINKIWAFNYKICEETFRQESVKRLLKSDEKFDLVMVESTFGQESLLFFGQMFSAPTIVLETFHPWSLVNWDAGNALSVATVPDLQAVTMTNERMSFLERMLNVISTLRTVFWYHHHHLPRHDEILQRLAPSAPRPRPVAQLVSGVSLYLTNGHPTSVNYVTPYTPNIVAVGGINIRPEKQPLDKDLERFMDGAGEAGVVYFSLGTVVPAHTMGGWTLSTFLAVFRRLPQRVVWKIDLDASSVADLPPNVRLVKWAPQLGILGHRRCRLFITHGGIFSHHEAIYSGVPTLGIPFFGDQPYNIRFSEHRQTGLMYRVSQLSEQSLYEAITTVLQNPKYKDNAQRLSRIYRDRPMSPKDTAVFWVEYVLRHKGADHLRPVSSAMPWYQLLLLDVIAVSVTSLFIILSLTYRIIKFLLSLFKRGCNIRVVDKPKKKN